MLLTIAQHCSTYQHFSPYHRHCSTYQHYSPYHQHCSPYINTAHCIINTAHRIINSTHLIITDMLCGEWVREFWYLSVCLFPVLKPWPHPEHSVSLPYSASHVYFFPRAASKDVPNAACLEVFSTNVYECMPTFCKDRLAQLFLTSVVDRGDG